MSGTWNAGTDGGTAPGVTGTGVRDFSPVADGRAVADGLHLPTWRRAPLAAPATAGPGAWLVLADEAGIGGRLAGRLKALGHDVAVAQPGDRFARVGDRVWTVRPGSPADLAALRDALHATGTRPRHVVHLWGIDPVGEDAGDAFARAQAHGYATVSALAAVFPRGADEGPLRLTVITEAAQDLAGGEAVRPERATVLGACLTLSREHPDVACRTVDVRRVPGGMERLVGQLLAEVTAEPPETVAALRGPLRWARSHQPVRPSGCASGLRRGGAYLFSGAPAAGGAVLAAQLAAALDARAAILVDPAFPHRGEWGAWLAAAAAHDPTGQTIRGIRAIEAGGGETLLLRPEPGDGASLREAIETAHEAFGGLDGVIHTASATPEADPGEELARMNVELDALWEATDGVPLDFVLLLGAGVCAAGSALLGGWAQRVAAEGGRWTAVDGGRWPDAHGPALFERLTALAGEPRVTVSAQAPRVRPDARSGAAARALAGGAAG